MPRPKKPGAPEPKRRSRNGCWPCKTRKVKCDETRPTCLNCQKQGETCDYSIRLNWEGRGKKQAEVSGGPGQINFSAGMISAGPSRPITRVSGGGPKTSPVGFQTSPFGRQHQSAAVEMQGQPRSNPAFANQSPQEQQEASQLPPPRSVPSEMSTIDPALMASLGSTAAMYNDSTYGGMHGRLEPQYRQSYERCHSPTPGTMPVHPPAVPRFRQARALEDAVSSPSETGIGSPAASTLSSRSTALPSSESSASTPSFFGNARDNGEFPPPDMVNSDRPLKRVRYQSGQDANSPSYDPTMPPPNMTSYLTTYNIESQASSVILAAPNSAGTPLTPASSHSDDALRDSYKVYPARLSPPPTHDSPDPRRLSVSSLLSAPPGMSYQNDRTFGGGNRGAQDWSHQSHDIYQDTTTYGIDRGFKDLDIGKNDDMNAISGSSPVSTRAHLDLVLGADGEFLPMEFGFGMEESSTALENGAYYDKPVPVCIPRALEPLPSKLLENPMNLLYFHHFINHTADCLIPHNCSSNPFKSTLPQMAVQDDNLLNLLLAYSASHRARLLRQPEPATRIALWVQDIFPNLRRALDHPSEIISNANLATAIMLASLEIISPKAFGVSVPWQIHLDTARQMIAARGGPQRMKTASRGDKVSSFLWSWFAYLDVLGSLSGGKANASSSTWILDYEIDEEDDYQIDCILGFTSRCIRILAKIAELSRICDSERIGPDHSIRADWQPSDDVVARAGKLESDLAASRLHPAKPCTHMQSTGEAAYQWDSLEMAATNEAFHWGGLVHLHRRILGKPSTHNDVQTAVREIFGALYKVRRGSSAEACLLFPMFTAGCDTQDERQRADILERIKGVERFGMTQVHKARTLMERVWETGKPWETLMAGEFFG